MHQLLEQWGRSLPDPSGPAWWANTQQTALAALREHGLPQQGTETWKYSSLRWLKKQAPALGSLPLGERAAPDSLLNAENCIPVFIHNGRLSNCPETLPEGLQIIDYSKAVNDSSSLLSEAVSQLPGAAAEFGFNNLNSAALHGGVVIQVADNVVLDQPILLHYSQADAGAAALMNFRVVLLLGTDSHCHFVEQYESLADNRHWQNVVLQVQLAEGAALRHVRLQQEAAQAGLVTYTDVQQAAASQYRYRGFDLGGRWVRHDVQARLQAAGAQADLGGAYVIQGRMHIDNHTAIDHSAPDCISREVFQGVVAERGSGVFNGRVLIRAGADGSDTHQSNGNLLLSPHAQMNTKPELEIYADDVVASHGATVGQLDPEALFYMRSRGLDADAAKRLLTYAFCAWVVDTLQHSELRESIAKRLQSVMPIT